MEPSTSLSLSSICIYCGSSNGTDPRFKSNAFEVGRFIAQQSKTLVYGGGSVGLMGAAADGALSVGGKVIGVIPQGLKDLEVDHKGLSEMYVVSNMHERKMKMATLSDAFIALPGGIGTLEELFEVFTWTQLDFHRKPCAVLNQLGYYDLLIDFLNKSVQQGFLKQQHLDDLITENEIEPLLKRLTEWEYSPTKKV